MTQLQEVRLIDKLRKDYTIYINGIRASKADIEMFQELIISDNMPWTLKFHEDIVNLLTF